jgi:gliding motility-associated-like protein
MYGGAEQIAGSVITTFDNLNVTGGPVTKLQKINAVTAGLLQLNDAELATDVNQMLVSNTDPDAITRNNGFVSSVTPGMLARATNTSSAYLFPMGSPSYAANAPSIYRPVEMTPASSDNDTYGDCLVKGDATNDGYNVDLLDTVLCRVDSVFYHRLYQVTGSDDVALAMFYNPGIDGDWTDIAHWKNNLWNDVPPPGQGSSMGFSSVSVPNVSDFTPDPFALGNRKFTVTTGPAISITMGESTTLNAVINVPGNPFITWSPDYSLSCDSCLNPVASPDETTLYTIHVTNGGGCSASDSVLVNVLGTALLIPTGFSPNNDGVNDVFRVLNKNLLQVDLQVFDRWGNKIFESTDPGEGWDGSYKNGKADMGVYVWQCSYMLDGDTKTRYAKGNVTLVK